MDVLGAQAAVLAGEQREHLLARAAGAVTRRDSSRCACSSHLRSPRRMDRCEDANENDFHVCLSARAWLWLLCSRGSSPRRLRLRTACAAAAAPRVVATTTQVADLVRNVGGARVDVTRSSRPTPTRTSTRCARATSRRVAGATSWSPRAATSTRWLGDATDGAGTHARSSSCSTHCRAGSRRSTRTGGRTRATRVRAVAAIRDALARPTRRAPPASAPRRRATRAASSASTPRSPLLGAVPPRAAHARHHARRARLLRRPLRDRRSSAPSSRRCRPQAQPSAGDTAELVDAIQPRAA